MARIAASSNDEIQKQLSGINAVVAPIAQVSDQLLEPDEAQSLNIQRSTSRKARWRTHPDEVRKTLYPVEEENVGHEPNGTLEAANAFCTKIRDDGGIVTILSSLWIAKLLSEAAN